MSVHPPDQSKENGGLLAGKEREISGGISGFFGIFFAFSLMIWVGRVSCTGRGSKLSDLV